MPDESTDTRREEQGSPIPFTLLQWHDVHELAEEMVGYLCEDDTTVDWLQTAWEALTKAAMTAYSTAQERLEVWLRLMTLATLYHEFRCLAYEDCWEPPLDEWCELLGIREFDLGVLLTQRAPEVVNDCLEDNVAFDRIDHALRYLVDDYREELFQALQTVFGDRGRLFISLYWPGYPLGDPPLAETEGAKMLRSIDYDEHKAAVFRWLDEGFPRV